jgi:hypothetical protein
MLLALLHAQLLFLHLVRHWPPPPLLLPLLLLLLLTSSLIGI